MRTSRHRLFALLLIPPLAFDLLGWAIGEDPTITRGLQVVNSYEDSD
jgi:hypothetical protein